MDDKFNKENPFKVPEGYFEGLSAKIEERIKDVEPLPRQSYFKRVVMPRLRPILYVAAVVAFIYGVGFVATRPSVNDALEQERLRAEQPEEYDFDEAVELYYLDEMDFIDIYEFVSMND